MTKDERIAELEREVAKKDELIKQLGEANKFLSSDKAVSTEQVKQIAREVQLKVMKENIKIIYSTIRHQVCEEIRENSIIQIINDDYYCCIREGKLDQIEQGDKE